MDEIITQLKKEKILFLDLETTGLSPAKSSIILFGLANLRGEIFQEISSNETELLEKCLPLLADKRVISYNGDRFDLPFLAKRAQIKGLAEKSLKVLSSIDSLDLYPKLRQISRFYGWTSFKLTSFEDIAGFKRTDRLSGRAIASAAKSPDNEEVRSLLALHNREDLLGLIAVYRYYEKILQELTLSPNSSILGQSQIRLESFGPASKYGKAVFSVRPPVAMKGFRNSSFADLYWEKDQLTLTFPLIDGYLHGQKLRVAVGPAGMTDASPWKMKSPLFVVSDEALDYEQNIIGLAELLLKA